MEKFAGSWKCVESENFDEFLKAVGVGFAIRQVVSRLKPTMTITVGGDGTVTIKNPQSAEMTCRLGEEFEHTSNDKRKTKNVISLNNGKLHHSQKWEDKEITIEREVTGDKLITKMNHGGVEAVRTFVKEA